ncbi:hypothetical protein [Acidovorax sp.]|uniref:hypothetical protein n=1 Tax=Acidovorax sp. TaxID=1872122 RepID=UPI0025C0B82D|nr:hypothetical protein [Acidovorax sp.]MBL7090470.1 hypothetical protein [Acidovorax sp.]
MEYFAAASVVVTQDSVVPNVGLKEILMTKKTKAELARHQHDAVYTQWIGRPPDRRHTSDTEDFADDLWSQGIRMGRNQELHRQMVMNVIRSYVVTG